MNNLKKDAFKVGKWWILGFVVSFIALKLSEYYLGESSILCGLLAMPTLATAIVGGVYAAFIIIFCFLELFAKLTGKAGKRFGGMEKSDFLKSKEYYRELLVNYSPLVLGYIDGFKINKNHLIAEVLWLKNKGLIDFEDGKVIDDSYNKKNLIKSFDNMFLENLKKGKIKTQDFDLIENRIIDSLLEQNLLCEKKKELKKSDWVSFMGIISLISVALMGIGGILESFPIKVVWIEKLNLFLGLVSALGLLVAFVFLILYMLIGFFKVNYVESRGKKVFRSSNGKELNKKLEGLKAFLQDYSMLSEREAKEVELWEDYLIYSVMFGQNDKIVEEYEKYIEIN